MAKGVSWTGSLDTSYWVNAVKKAGSKSKAISVISEMMDAANKWGITDNDQKAVVQAINAYSKSYNVPKVDLERIYNVWDPNKNHINSVEYGSGYKKFWEDVANDPGVIYTGESVNIAEKNANQIVKEKTENPTTISSEQYKETTGKTSIPSEILAQQQAQNKPQTNTSRPNYSTPSYNDSALRQTIEELTNQIAGQKDVIDKLTQDIYDLQHPYVPTAEELAAQYDISDMYNKDYWQKIYDQATNQYYDSAVDEQNRIRNSYIYNSGANLNRIVDDYLQSYVNAAPTADGKAAIAANALSAGILGNYMNADNDYGMLQSINQLQEDRKAELANNPNLAQQAYNNLGSYLMTNATMHNQNMVDNYVNELKAYTTKYTSARDLSAAYASAAASGYAGLAKAADTVAASKANSYNNNLYQQLFDVYKIYGNKQNTAYLNGAGLGN